MSTEGGGRVSQGWRDTLYHVIYPMMHVMLPPLKNRNNRQTPVKTLPSRNYYCGWYKIPENGEKYWKSQDLLSVRKSGNRVIILLVKRKETS